MDKEILTKYIYISNTVIITVTYTGKKKDYEAIKYLAQYMNYKIKWII